MTNSQTEKLFLWLHTVEITLADMERALKYSGNGQCEK